MANYTIPVDIALRTDAKNVDSFIKNLEQKVANANISDRLFNISDTTIKKMRKELDKVNELMTHDNLTGLEGKQLERSYRQIEKFYNNLFDTFQKAGYKELGFDDIIAQQFADAGKKISDIENKKRRTVRSTKTKDRLDQDTLSKAKSFSRFDENANLSQNISLLKEEEKAVDDLIGKFGDLAEVQKKVAQSQQEVSKANDDLKNFKESLSGKQLSRVRSAEKYGNLTRKKGASYKSSFDDGLNWFKDAVEDFGGIGQLSLGEDKNNLAGEFFKAIMGFDKPLSQAEIDQYAQMNVEQLVTTLESKIKQILQSGSKTKISQLLNNELFGEGGKFKQNASNYVAQNGGAKIQAAQDQFKQYSEKSQTAQNNLTNLQNIESRILNAQNNLSLVINNLHSSLAKLKEEIDNVFQSEAENAQNDFDNLRNKHMPQQTANILGGNPNPPEIDDPLKHLREENESAAAAAAAKADAESFKKELQQSIRQWMGMREVIGKIKDGIRQAYSDIKSLDQAMTNIAVVTDFSVSDLWGKINDYMSIAQQYGVTTQGVYEVSQLYFQQGLSEADTMAATTETLKMARIAGMDYADAADGMTVAIRGFNMEMQDAARVTDVYSKVAAITASDTQELVTAMSKTASSAAAVGSSFENTTAMLAVMIEATRESPQNLGSALKSIISRYGEMTKGLSEDSEGEEIDYNRVDTALKTVGISLKDAQGQFRDFDNVILELSKKWDTLDTVTQRYIATIFAGNRQQSRFLALVSNVDRYMEVSEAAANSEDAGLLQYSKTLDSLETKLNNIKTSFQQFYMSLIDGPTVGAVLDFINNLIKGFNKLGKLQTVLNLVGIIKNIKTMGGALVNSISSPMSGISNAFTQQLNLMLASAAKDGYRIGQTLEKNIIAGQQGTGIKEATNGNSKAVSKWKNAKAQKITSLAGSAIGLLGSAGGSWLSGAGYEKAGAIVSGIGAIGTGVSMGAAFGPWGAAIGGIVGALGSLPSIIKSFDATVQAQEKLATLREETKEKNIERAQAKSDYENLNSLLKQYKDLEETRYNNDETYEKWLDVNNQLTEAYPALLGYIDEHGNAIADITNASTLLSNAMQNAANATADYYYAKVAEIEQELRISRETVYAPHHTREYGKREAGYNNFLQAKQSALQYSTLDPHSRLQQMTSEQIMNWVEGEGIDLQKALADIQGHGKGYSGIADYLWFIGAIEKSAEGVYSWAEDFNKYIKATEQLQTLDATKKSGALAGISNASKLSTFDDAVEGISGYTALIETYATTFKNMSWEDLVKISEEDYDKLIREFVLFYDSLSTSQQEILSGLYDNLQNLSLSDLQSQFKDFGLEDTKLYQTYYKEWINQNYQARYKLAESIFGEDAFITKKDFYSQQELIALASGNQVRSLKDEKFGTYAEWLEQGGYEDNAINREIYYQRSIAFIKDINEGLGNFIEKSTLSQLQSYADFINKETSIQEGGGKAGEVSADRQKTITDLISRVYDEEDSFFSQLKPEALVEFFDLLFAEPSTNEWAKNLEQFETKYGDLGVNFFQLVFENFSTQTNMVLDEIDSFTKEIDDLTTKQEKGLTLSESFNLLKDLQKIDSSTTWDDIFKYNEEGILVLKDFNSVLNTLYEDQFNIEDLRSKYQTGLDFIKSLTQDKGILVSETLDLKPEAELKDYIDALSAGTDLSSEVVDSMATYLSQHADATVESFEDWYYQTFGVPLENAQQYLDNYNKIKLQEETIRTRTEELEGTLEERNKQTAYQMLSSKGLEGYSADEIAQLERYLGVGVGGLGAVETGEGTGEYKILAENLGPLETWVWNAINNIVADSAKSAEEGLSNLGEAIASRQQLSFREKKEFLGSEFNQIGEEALNTIWNYYELALTTNTEEGFENLEKQLALLYISRGEESEVAIRIAKERVAIFRDQIDENTQNILDLKLALLEKTISNEDLTTLTTQDANFVKKYNEAFDEKITKGITSRASKIYELYSQYYNDLLVEGEITFEEARTKKADAAAKQFDEALRISEIGGAKVFEKEAKESLLSGDRLFDTQELGNFYTALIEKTGLSIEDFLKEYMIGMTETGEVLLNLQKLTSESILSEKEYAQFKRNFAEETFGSAEDLITRMASGEDVYADEIESFFEALGVSLQEGEAESLLQNGVQVFLGKIESILLATGIPQSDINNRLAEIQAQLIDLLLESISSGISSLGEGIEGTLSNQDWNSLIEKYSGLKDADVTRTIKGVKLSDSAQLQLATAQYSEALSKGATGWDFAEQLWEVAEGADSAFGSIEAIEKALEGATGEAKQLLQQLLNIAMLDEDDPIFNFMEQDPTGGKTANFDNFVSQIDKVKDVFSAFKSGEYIDYKDFYNMMDFMDQMSGGALSDFSKEIDNSMPGLQKLQSQLMASGKSYEEFVNAVVANTDKWGKVDIGGVAAQMEISVDAAMQGMAEGMTDGLKEVARQQIKYLTGLEQMLLAMLAFEDIGDIGFNLSIGFDVNNDGTVDPETEMKKLSEWLEEFSGWPDETKKRFIIELVKENEDKLFDSQGIFSENKKRLDEMFGEGFSDSLNKNIFDFNKSGAAIGLKEGGLALATNYMDLVAAMSRADLDPSGNAANGVAEAMTLARNKFMEGIEGAVQNDKGQWVDAEGKLIQLTQEQNQELLRILAQAAKSAQPIDIEKASKEYYDAFMAGETQKTVEFDGFTIDGISKFDIELTLQGSRVVIKGENGKELTDEQIKNLTEEELTKFEEAFNNQNIYSDNYYNFVKDVNGNIQYRIIPKNVKAAFENLDGTADKDGILTKELTIGEGKDSQTYTINYDLKNYDFEVTIDGKPIKESEMSDELKNQIFETFGLSPDGDLVIGDGQDGSLTLKSGIELTDSENLSLMLKELTSIKELLSGEEGIKLSFDTSTGLEEAENSITTWIEGIKALLTDIPITFSPTGLGNKGNGEEEEGSTSTPFNAELLLSYKTAEGSEKPADLVDKEITAAGTISRDLAAQILLDYKKNLTSENPEDLVDEEITATGTISRDLGAQLALAYDKDSTSENPENLVDEEITAAQTNATAKDFSAKLKLQYAESPDSQTIDAFIDSITQAVQKAEQLSPGSAKSFPLLLEAMITYNPAKETKTPIEWFNTTYGQVIGKNGTITPELINLAVDVLAKYGLAPEGETLLAWATSAIKLKEGEFVESSVDVKVLAEYLETLGLTELASAVKTAIESQPPVEAEYKVNLKPIYDDSSVSGMDIEQFDSYLKEIIEKKQEISDEDYSSLYGKFMNDIVPERGFVDEATQELIDGIEASLETINIGDYLKPDVENVPQVPVEGVIQNIIIPTGGSGVARPETMSNSMSQGSFTNLFAGSQGQVPMIPVYISPLLDPNNPISYLLWGSDPKGNKVAPIPIIIDPKIAEGNIFSSLFGGEGENNLETNEITQQLTTFITEIAEALNSIDFSTVSNALMDVCTQIQNVANNFNAIQAAGDIFASITSGALAAYFPLYMIWYSLINTVTQLDQIKNHQALQEMSKDATEAMDSIMGIDGAVEDLRTAFQIFREENPFLFGDQEEKSKIDILFSPIIDPNNPLAPYLGGTSENPFATTGTGGITIPINPVIAEDNPLIAFFGVGGTTEDSGNAISTMIQNVANSLSSIDASGIKEVSKAIDDLGSRDSKNIDKVIKEISKSLTQISKDKVEINLDSSSFNHGLQEIKSNWESLKNQAQEEISVAISNAEALDKIQAISTALDDLTIKAAESRVVNLETGEAQSNLNQLLSTLKSIAAQIERINGSGGINITLPAFTGSINNITSGPAHVNGTVGTAYADGSIGRFQSGAQLANKTLVGELGPELAVYNGQYHLLGQTGAEFVKLPKNAIVFNHLQTAGIISGQMKDARGKPLTPPNAKAFATGNVTGPALASGVASALAAVQRAKSVWQGLLNSLSVADLLGGGGGGGGGGGNDPNNNLQAHIEDLQEWYNLSRQIVDLEQQINLLLAERANITDGHEYLRNLRETQALLEDQVNTQKDLLRFQELQLANQAKFINNNAIWSQFLHVDENGLLQYNDGNETGGGKGGLSVLDELNSMSAKDQIAYIKSLGYTFTTNDDEELEDEELVAQFYEDLQKQIDDYDALRDSVQETKVALQELETEINEIEREIRDNEINLSQEIYDIIVDSWEKNIELLKEQNELIQEANEAYAEGIQKALDAEREMYEQNKSITDREQLQRQLSLLRRSGGSASEIEDLEQQLDEMLKEEYFTKQEEAIENIREANERQVELMEQQIKIQEEQLEYQKENGVIWQKVYEVMQGTDAEIAAFMTGHHIEFFQKSALVQEDMLLEWAKMIGIYNEEKAYQMQLQMAEDSGVWEGNSKLESVFNTLDAEHQAELMREYQDRYATALGEGASETEATTLAQQELYEHLENYKKYLEAQQRKEAVAASAPSSSSSSGGSSSSSGSSSKTTRVTMYNAAGQKMTIVTNDPSSAKAQLEKSGYNSNSLEEVVKKNQELAKKELASGGGAAVGYATGGIIDYTGPAWVDGTKSRPERILSVEQNRILEEGLAMNAGYGDRLKERFSDFASRLGSSIKESISNITNNDSSSNIEILPGAIQLQISQLNDKYDVDELYNDITDRLYQVAAKASGRSIKRR